MGQELKSPPAMTTSASDRLTASPSCSIWPILDSCCWLQDSLDSNLALWGSNHKRKRGQCNECVIAAYRAFVVGVGDHVCDDDEDLGLGLRQADLRAGEPLPGLALQIPALLVGLEGERSLLKGGRQPKPCKSLPNNGDRENCSPPRLSTMACRNQRGCSLTAWFC